MRRFFIITSVLVIAFLHLAIVHSKVDGDENERGCGCLARVGKEIILDADVLPLIDEYMAEVASNHPEAPADEIAASRERLITSRVQFLIDVKLLLSDARATLEAKEYQNAQEFAENGFEKSEVPVLLMKYKLPSRTELESHFRKHDDSLEHRKRLYVEAQLAHGWLVSRLKSPSEKAAVVDEDDSEFKYRKRTYLQKLREVYAVEIDTVAEVGSQTDAEKAKSK